MHRFFVSPTAIQGDRTLLGGTVARQLTQVLRVRPGERLTLLDDSGWEYTAIVASLARGEVEARIIDRAEAQGEPATRLTLFQALLKGERFAWVLQKGTELGIAAFVPLVCTRNVVRDRGPARDKMSRWQTIIREAAEQSGRGRLPRLEPPVTFAVACQRAQQSGGLSLLAWEEEKSVRLKDVLRSEGHRLPGGCVQLFIGPEGGLTADEAALARVHGLVPVGLGPRTLRSETAGLAAAAAILYERGDLG